MFAATAATIVSGAVAERVRLQAFLICGLRVSEEEELIGRDAGEHGMAAYTGLHFDHHPPQEAPATNPVAAQ